MRSAEQQQDFEFLTRLIDRIAARIAEKGYAALTPPEKTLYVVWSLEGEVNNGGFDQYFFNSAGDNAMDAPAAFERIRAPRTAALVREVLKLFPNSGPAADRFIRQQQLEPLSESERFEVFDDRFYEYPEDLERLLVEYARANLDQLPR